MILAAPTNAGKSLVGLLALLDGVRQGGRALLVAPLRAIAREKADELAALAPGLADVLGRPVTVRISTGDYRLEHEVFAAPPPKTGELIIATPERVDAILRDPKHDAWFGSIRAVCVDEAHLIGSPDRGPTLEYVITALLCLPVPPRIVLLSASLGDIEQARAWLDPCDVIRVTGREPPLHKEVWELDPEDDVNAAVINFARKAVTDSAASVLVFVYQTRSAEKLADRLNVADGPGFGEDGALAYHAQMSAAQRERVRSAFHSGRSRCVVTTTALGLGVNLPATHVIVRDTTFPGVRTLEPAELLQMMGRAGRDDRPGEAVVLVRPTEDRSATDTAQALREEKLPDLVSVFDRLSLGRDRVSSVSEGGVVTAATRIVAHLARCSETGIDDSSLRKFFERSLGGRGVAPLIGSALTWLMDATRLLAFRGDDGRYHLTVLGLGAARAALPLSLAAGVGQLVRDLLVVDKSDRLLASWRPLDHLLVLELLSDRSPTLRTFSATLAEQVDAWMEAAPSRVPLLYREWIAGQPGGSRAAELIGSVGVDVTHRDGDRDEAARRHAYLATFRSIMLYERGQGVLATDLERRWGVTGLDGTEERWRDNSLWLLSGLVRLLDVRSFYAHLRGECNADSERVRRVKALLGTIRHQIFDFREDLKYCSPLGPILRVIRRSARSKSGQTVGIQSIRKLEESGLRTIADLASANLDDLVRAGVRRDLAAQVRAYVRRRLQ